MKTLKAVYYCRVSTDDENQASSIVNQKAECIKTISDNNWELVDSYIDEGKSGTTTKQRNEYNRLFKDIETNRFDIIVIKSQDRLMRNTKEWYFFIDKLVQNNKRLYFYLDKKFYSPDDALITGIKAILAEDYSRSLSKNINNAHRKRQESGSNVVITSKTWGYDNVNKKIVINESESQMIKFIYEMACQNYGSRTIAKMLQERGYTNREGNHIAEQTVRRIIRNPLYKGTAVMNKFHKNFETKRTERIPENEWIYHDGIVPAIVSEELWNKANDLMDKRSEAYITEDFKTRIIGSKKNSNILTSKIVCGLCGNNFWRTVKTQNGNKKIYWSCKEYVQRGRKTKGGKTPTGITKQKIRINGAGCDNIHIKETDLDELIYRIAQKIYQKSNEDIVSAATKILKQIIGDSYDISAKENELHDELDKLQSHRENLLDKYLDGKIDDDIYHIKDSNIKDKISEIELKLQKINYDKNTITDKENRIQELQEEIKSIADYDLSVNNIKKHIEKIEVFSDYLIFRFDMFEDIKVSVKKINYRKVEYSICL